MEIAPFSPGLVDQIASLIVPIQQNEYGIQISYKDQPDLTDIPGFYQKGAGQFWTAMDQGHVVGTIALLDIGNREGALRKMFVAPPYRGQTYGTATKLLENLLAHAKAKGLQAIYLGTTEKFLAAHRFYEKTGFALIHQNELPPSFPRMKIDTRFYRRDLSEQTP